MILVTVGTNEQPFDRLVRAAAALAPEGPLLVQYGSSRERHGAGEWVDYLSFDELAERASEARVVVCHAGVGSMMLARRCGHRPIVVPRRHDLGEAVDDHQLALAVRLHEARLVRLLLDESALAEAVRRPTVGVVGAAASRLDGAEALSAELRSLLAGLGAVPAARRAA